MYFLLDILLVLLGASMLWYRDPLAGYFARCNITSLVLGLGPILASSDGSTVLRRPGETSFIPVMAIAFLFLGVLWLWKGAY
jgi:hypothetical protein